MSEATNTVASPGEAHFSCRLLKAMVVAYRMRFGEERLAAALKDARLPRDLTLQFLEEETNWVSFETGSALVDVLTEGSKEPLFPRQAGLLQVSREVLGSAYGMLRAFGNPRLCYGRVLALSSLYNRVGRFDVKAFQRNHILVSYTSTKKEANRRICEYRMGQFQSVPTLWNLPPARVVEQSCQLEGHASCAYDIEWVSEGALWQRLAVVALGVLTGWWAAMQFGLPSQPMWLVGGVCGFLAQGYWQARVNSGRARILLEEQTSDLIQAMSQQLVRFEEVQALNRSLEAKVEERTKHLAETSKQLEEALARQRELDKLKTQFFTHVSHDLRSPLTVLTGALTSLMVQREPLAAEQKQFLEMGMRSATRLESMINDMLDLAKVDSGVARLQLVRADLRDIVEELLRVSQPLAHNLEVMLKATLPERPLFARLDVGMMERVLMNLIVNACKFSHAGGEVEVRLFVEEGQVIIEVEDHGIGIPEAELPLIFDRFSRATNAQQQRVKGTGLGLAVVKEFVELHGGAVSVRSKPDVGSTFRVRLPITEETSRAGDRERALLTRDAVEHLFPEERTNAPAPADEGPSHGPPVLVVEDSDEVRKYLRVALSREYSVMEARDGKEALALAASRHPCAVLSDVSLPGMNGLEICRRLRQSAATHDLPILLFSGRTDLQARLDAFAAGADDFLAKPFDPRELSARLEAVLRRTEGGEPASAFKAASAPGIG